MQGHSYLQVAVFLYLIIGKIMERIHARGILIKECKGGHFIVDLPDYDHEVIARISGKIRIRKINLSAGDEVKVELSPYDLTRGRIIWRF